MNREPAHDGAIRRRLHTDLAQHPVTSALTGRLDDSCERPITRYRRITITEMGYLRGRDRQRVVRSKRLFRESN
jgi:hypothetical protein